MGYLRELFTPLDVYTLLSMVVVSAIYVPNLYGISNFSIACNKPKYYANKPSEFLIACANRAKYDRMFKVALAQAEMDVKWQMLNN